MADRSISQQPEATGGPIMSFLENRVVESMDAMTAVLASLKEEVIRQNGRIGTVEVVVKNLKTHCSARDLQYHEQGKSIVRLETAANMADRHATERTQLMREDIGAGKQADIRQDDLERSIAEKVWTNRANIALYGMLVILILSEIVPLFKS